jgi:hypothetical protein
VLLTWLRLAGITSGPIFPQLNKAHTALLPNTRMLATTYEQQLRRLFDYVQGTVMKCSSHSVRNSAAAWAARCGVPEHMIISCGRWANNSNSFHSYVQYGLEIQKKLLGVDQHASDPVLSFWVFRSQVVNLLGS